MKTTTMDGPWGGGPAAATSDRPEYAGTRGQVFGLALLRSILTILTLGLARFWMTTRLRRHYWSSIRVGGQPLEYTGTAIELFVGFLMAVVILATYLALANLMLFFIGLSYFQGHELGLQLPLLAILPMTFWAQYRAMRYLFARTRWRGVRFGLEPGAWGYMWRCLGWAFATLFSLGLLYPSQQLNLSRYVTRHMRYGDLRFRQEGRLWPLMRVWLLFWGGLVLLVGAPALLGYFAYVGAVAAGEGGEATAEAMGEGFIAWMLGASPLLLLVVVGLYLAYQVHAFRYLHSNKVLGGSSHASVRLSFWRVVGIYVGGTLVISIVGSLIAGIVLAIVFAVAGADMQALSSVFEDGALAELLDPRRLGALIPIVAGYLLAIAVFMALYQAFITMPLLRAAVTTSTIHGLDAAARARQRDHDRQAEAGGFADALGAGVGPV
ncbi:MAG: DUF898 family protein [Pseudomonadota bacterium]